MLNRSIRARAFVVGLVYVGRYTHTATYPRNNRAYIMYAECFIDLTRARPQSQPENQVYEMKCDIINAVVTYVSMLCWIPNPFVLLDACAFRHSDVIRGVGTMMIIC